MVDDLNLRFAGGYEELIENTLYLKNCSSIYKPGTLNPVQKQSSMEDAI